MDAGTTPTHFRPHETDYQIAARGIATSSAAKMATVKHPFDRVDERKLHSRMQLLEHPINQNPPR
jgi:hypothetical protein